MSEIVYVGKTAKRILYIAGAAMSLFIACAVQGRPNLGVTLGLLLVAISLTVGAIASFSK